MMRCILRPVFSKHPSVNQKAKFLMERKQTTSKWRSVFRETLNDFQVRHEIHNSMVKTKQGVSFRTCVTSALGLLSGCCFSKTSDENAEITQNLLENEKSEGNNVLEDEKNEAGKLLEEEKSEENIDILIAGDVNVAQDIENCMTFNRVDDTSNTQECTENVIINEQRTENIVEKEVISSSNATEIVDHTTRTPMLKKRKWKLKSKQMEDSVTFDDSTNTGAKQKQVKEPKLMPNYFVAFQVSNPKIHESLLEVQRHIAGKDRRLASAFVSIPKSHITLMVMHLQDKDDHAKALEVLKVIHKELNSYMTTSPLKLHFKGIGNFRNQVVFAKVEEEGLVTLKECAEIIENCFKNADIVSTDKPGKAFNPHLTILKLRQNPRLYRMGIKKVDPALYDDYKNHFFGDQIVTSIQLLSMGEWRTDEKGYYMGDEIMFNVCDSK